MIYSYECRACSHEFEVMKSIKEALNPENCPKCDKTAHKIFTPPMISVPKGFQADYYPSLGKVFNTKKELEYHTRDNNLVCVGNDFGSGNEMSDSFDKDREYRRQKAWENLDI